MWEISIVNVVNYVYLKGNSETEVNGNSFCEGEILQLLFLGHCSLQKGMASNQLLCITEL